MALGVVLPLDPVAVRSRPVTPECERAMNGRAGLAIEDLDQGQDLGTWRASSATDAGRDSLPWPDGASMRWLVDPSGAARASGLEALEPCT